MTRDNALWICELIRDRDAKTDAEVDALNMAIEALKQEPSCRNTRQVDLISRQATIDALDDIHYTDRQDWWSVLSTVENLPSVHPKRGEWIPCSERLPEEHESVLVTVKGCSNDYEEEDDWVKESWLSNMYYNIWESDPTLEVIAWQPLPDPYKEREGE